MIMPSKAKMSYFFYFSPVLILACASYFLLQPGMVLGVQRNTTVPKPPSADAFMRCFSFSHPVKLKAQKMKPESMLNPEGKPESEKPIWANLYTAEKQMLSVYFLSLYTRSSYLGKNRREMEKLIVKQQKELTLRQREGISAIETRTNGRKVYFSIIGFGPGGAFYHVFTNIGNYDLVLRELVDFEDDVPEAKRVKNPAKARKSLLQAFKSLEQQIFGVTEKR